MPRRNAESFSGLARHEAAQPETSRPEAAIRQAPIVANRHMIFDLADSKRQLFHDRPSWDNA
jgi:hypothetical protein